MASGANQNEDIAYAIVRFFYISCFQASLSMNEEGFEGTDLAALSHLERPVLPEASWASQNEEVAEQLSFLYLCTFPFNKLMSMCLYTKNEPYRTRSSFWLAEREGFEPPEPLSSTVFKTAAIDHSAISPSNRVQKYCFFFKYTNF